MPFLVRIPDEQYPLPVTHLFDLDGDETNSLEDAASYVAGPRPDGRWWSGPTWAVEFVEAN